MMFKFDRFFLHFLNWKYVVRSSSWTKTLDKLFSITITCVIKNQGLFLAIQYEPSCTTGTHGNLSCKDKSTIQRTESDPKASFAARLSGELWTALAVAFQQKLYKSAKYDWHATSRSQIGVNCNMCVGKSVTSSDATPAIMQSQASHDLRFWCSRCKNQFVVSLIALHLCLHLHPDWHWLTAKKMVDAALHWPSPFRLACLTLLLCWLQKKQMQPNGHQRNWTPWFASATNMFHLAISIPAPVSSAGILSWNTGLEKPSAEFAWTVHNDSMSHRLYRDYSKLIFA